MQKNQEPDFDQVLPERSKDLPPIEALGWSVTDEEIDRVIKKLEEGWGV